MAKEEVQGSTEINAAKLKALQATIDKIEKDYGKGTIMKLGDQPKWEVFPTRLSHEAFPQGCPTCTRGGSRSSA